MPATELWAKEYYLVPLASRLKGDVVRVIADEDDTYISINELIVRRIDAGEFYEFTLTEPAIVSGSKPVLVAQYSTGTQVDNYERSLYPNGKLLTNIRDNGLGDNLIHQVAVNPALGVNYILVVKPSSETVVTLNGEPVDANLFQRLPTSYGGYYLAQIALPEGNYEVASDRPIIALDNTEYLTYFSDPAMMMVPPKAHYINRYSFVVPASEMPRNFINVVVPSDSIDSVVIDDEIIDARYFNVMEGSDYSYARLGVNIGHHVITAAKPFGLASYGFTADTSYAAIGGRRSLAGMDLAAINIASPSTTATMGEEYCVDFFTVDRSSKALGYITVDVVVNDEQASRARVVTDENGVGQYCYLALNSGKHTLSLSNNAIRANALIEWVSEPSNQLPPTITSMPVLVGGVGNHYSYAVKVDDPNSNASFTYQLLAHPDGMTIDPEGMISWPLAVRGRYTVAIEVMDETGLTAVQTYQLRINALPFVRTEPIKVIDMGTEYHSSILFDDADGVAGLTYELMSAPAEISVRTDFINGFYRVIIVIKTQTLAAGTYPVSFRITDVEGGVLDYSYDLLISNVAPRFTSTEWLVEGVAGERLSTVVKALDVADVVTYSFAGPVPVGMSINATTGLIEWLTALESPLVTRVTVVATDSYGVSISHALTFQLTETNKPVAFSDQQYRFQIPLTDPLGGLLSYELIDGPPSMTIDPQGVISWLPGAGEIGGYPVSVRITDSQGNESIYEFELMVALKADFPTILSEPITTADTEKPYRYPVKAFDPEGNRLSYWVSGSGDIAFDADTQLITWQPTLSEVGLQTITLSVSDDQGHSTEQQFTVRVTAPGPWNRRRCR
jgi:hypothetical protein